MDKEQICKTCKTAMKSKWHTLGEIVNYFKEGSYYPGCYERKFCPECGKHSDSDTFDHETRVRWVSLEEGCHRQHYCIRCNQIVKNGDISPHRTNCICGFKAIENIKNTEPSANPEMIGASKLDELYGKHKAAQKVDNNTADTRTIDLLELDDAVKNLKIQLETWLKLENQKRSDQVAFRDELHRLNLAISELSEKVNKVETNKVETNKVDTKKLPIPVDIELWIIFNDKGISGVYTNENEARVIHSKYVEKYPGCKSLIAKFNGINRNLSCIE